MDVGDCRLLVLSWRQRVVHESQRAAMPGYSSARIQPGYSRTGWRITASADTLFIQRRLDGRDVNHQRELWRPEARRRDS